MLLVFAFVGFYVAKFIKRMFEHLKKEAKIEGASYVLGPM